MLSLAMAICSSSCCLGPFIYALCGERTPKAIRQMNDYYSLFLVLIVLSLLVCICRCLFGAGDPALKKLERRALLVTVALDLAFLASNKMIALLL